MIHDFAHWLGKWIAAKGERVEKITTEVDDQDLSYLIGWALGIPGAPFRIQALLHRLIARQKSGWSEKSNLDSAGTAGRPDVRYGDGQEASVEPTCTCGFDNGYQPWGLTSHSPYCALRQNQKSKLDTRAPVSSCTCGTGLQSPISSHSLDCSIRYDHKSFPWHCWLPQGTWFAQMDQEARTALRERDLARDRLKAEADTSMRLRIEVEAAQKRVAELEGILNRPCSNCMNLQERLGEARRRERYEKAEAEAGHWQRLVNEWVARANKAEQERDDWKNLAETHSSSRHTYLEAHPQALADYWKERAEKADAEVVALKKVLNEKNWMAPAVSIDQYNKVQDRANKAEIKLQGVYSRLRGWIKCDDKTLEDR